MDNSEAFEFDQSKDEQDANKSDPKLVKRELLRQIGWLGGSLLLIRLSPAVRQIGASQISEMHLLAISMLSYISLFAFFVGNSLGLPMLVLIGREQDPKIRAEMVGGVLLAVAILSTVFVIAFKAFQHPILTQMGIGEIPGIPLCFSITLMMSTLLSFNIIFYYCLSAYNKVRFITLLEAVSNIMIIIGTFLSIRILKGSEAKLIGIVCTGLVIEICYFLLVAIILRNQIRLSMSKISEWWIKCKSMILGEFQNLILSYLVPLIGAFLFLRARTVEAAAAFNVGLCLENILCIPADSIVVCGTPWLASLWKVKHGQEWNKRVKMLGLISVGLVLGTAFLILPSLLISTKYIFGFKDRSSLVIVGIVLMSFLPVSIISSFECQFRVFEKQATLARSKFFAYFVVGLPLIYIFIKDGHEVAAVLFGYFVPSVFVGLWFYLKRHSLDEWRRSQPRFKLPEYLGATAKIKNVTFVPSTTCEVIDLNSNGLCISCPVENEKKFRVGGAIQGQFTLSNPIPINFEGVIRSVTIHRKNTFYFFKKKENLRIGVEFKRISNDGKRTIDDLIEGLMAKVAKAG